MAKPKKVVRTKRRDRKNIEIWRGTHPFHI